MPELEIPIAKKIERFLLAFFIFLFFVYVCVCLGGGGMGCVYFVIVWSDIEVEEKQISQSSYELIV